MADRAPTEGLEPPRTPMRSGLDHRTSAEDAPRLPTQKTVTQDTSSPSEGKGRGSTTQPRPLGTTFSMDSIDSTDSVETMPPFGQSQSSGWPTMRQVFMNIIASRGQKYKAEVMPTTTPTDRELWFIATDPDWRTHTRDGVQALLDNHPEIATKEDLALLDNELPGYGLKPEVWRRARDDVKYWPIPGSRFVLRMWRPVGPYSKERYYEFDFYDAVRKEPRNSPWRHYSVSCCLNPKAPWIPDIAVRRDFHDQPVHPGREIFRVYEGTVLLLQLERGDTFTFPFAPRGKEGKWKRKYKTSPALTLPDRKDDDEYPNDEYLSEETILRGEETLEEAEERENAA
ncbi:hypothetical protein EIP91_007654 [Steccherinum ochraceum]|uniref:Uncharacterized protein n=1 Tax=Steccherinum ochraceum TaxID=92696 RepID=A0A4R0RE89_9APHY|nr:hypothetical protein EIP91_007654 [Steccherinum ochraceum]